MGLFSRDKVLERKIRTLGVKIKSHEHQAQMKERREVAMAKKIGRGKRRMRNAGAAADVLHRETERLRTDLAEAEAQLQALRAESPR